jgi:hypothetical protein
MKQLVIFPRGQLAAKDKEKMTKMGICAIEADDPSKVVTLIPGMTVSGDMIAMAALDAMAAQKGYSYSEAHRARFTENLHRKLKERESAP